MLNRSLIFIAALAGVALLGTEIRAAAALEVQLYPLSGDVRILNSNPSDFFLSYYELRSAANAFTGAPAAWTSIAENYDAHTINPGSTGFVDSVNDWIKLSTTTSKVAEGLFVGSTSKIPAARSIDLGHFWNPETIKPNDVATTILDQNQQLVSSAVVVALVGDYNHDLVVDIADYSEWRAAVGSLAAPYADGNFDGVVDAADYTVWRDNFGTSLIGAGYGALAASGGGSLAVSIVPEPATLFVALSAGSALLALRRPRRRRPSI